MKTEKKTIICEHRPVETSKGVVCIRCDRLLDEHSPLSEAVTVRVPTTMGPDPLTDAEERNIRARWSSAQGQPAEFLAARYSLDVGRLLDEIDRLRYDAEHN